MIYPGSRYYDATTSTLTRIADSDDVYQLAVLRTVPQQSMAYNLYVWKGTDRPDSVAAAQLGDPALWWQIFDVNPELLDPLNVPAGTLVRIPVLAVNELNQ